MHRKRDRIEDSGQRGPSYTFSHTAFSAAHDITETPQLSTEIPHATDPSIESIPLTIFDSESSTMQTVARYLVDIRGLSFSQAARLLGRNPKSIWTSYHQARPLATTEKSKETLRIPLTVFTGTRPPLEAIVSHLRALGLRNIDIARALRLDPRTVWTVAKRSEVRA